MDEVPSSSHENWFKKLVYDWAKYLGDFIWTDPVEVTPDASHGTNVDAITATGRGNGTGVVGVGGANSGVGGSFVGGAPNGIGVMSTVNGTGSAIIANAASGTGPAITADANASTWAMAVTNTGTGNVVRAESIGATQPTIYAIHDGTSNAGRFQTTSGSAAGVLISTIGSGYGLDVSAVNLPGIRATASSNSVAIEANGWVQVGGTDPAINASVKNVLTRRNIVQAAASFSIATAGGGTYTPGAISAGQNVDTVTRQSATKFRVPFANDFASANYVLVVSVLGDDGAGNYYPVAATVQKAAGYADIIIFRTDTGAAVNLDTGPIPDTYYVNIIATGLMA